MLGHRRVGTIRLSMVDAKPRRIPEATVIRLPVYQRILLELVRAGTTTVASDQLADMARVNASKVRKDLSFLGSFGTRGSGYDTQFLLAQIDRELGLDGDWPVAIVGLGNLGRALANSQGFTSRGFRVCGLFDVEPDAGRAAEIQGSTVHHLDDFETVVGRRPADHRRHRHPGRRPPRTWPTGWSPPAWGRCSTSPPGS